MKTGTEDALNRLRRDRVDDLAGTASLLGSWMSDQKYTIAEQLAILELLRSSILVNYIRREQMEGMAKFIAEHPEAKVVVVDAKKPPAPRPTRTANPDRN
jgi:dsDNA-binding SOS-regulon protein